MESLKELEKIYKGKRVLITGHTGFKGSWLSLVLNLLGAEIFGISSDCKTKKGPYFSCEMGKRLKEDIRLDIRESDALKEYIKNLKPDFIFHLAAQALVSHSYQYPYETIITNAIGTLNVLEAIKFSETNLQVILITSDKCYENIETFYGYRETDRLGGKDPYSASKACAEIIANSYIRSILNTKNNINIATARAGNVIGGGDWSENRLIPDAVNHWQNNKTLLIRNPQSTRPWQHVLEPISGYLLLGKFLIKNKLNNKELGGNSFNFGPKQIDTVSVEEVIKKFSKTWNNSKYEIINNNSFEEAGLLNLSCDKSTKILGWEPRLRIKEALLMTSNWYQEQLKKKKMYNFTISQIEDFFD